MKRKAWWVRLLITLAAVACVGMVVFSIAFPESRDSVIAGLYTSLSANPAPPYTVVPASRPESWWNKRHQALVDRAQQATPDVLFVGDSITAGINLPLLQSYFGADADICGISGDGTQHLLWRLQHGEIDYASGAPKVVVVLIGTNNIQSVHRLTVAGRHNVFLGVQAVVDEIRTKLPNTKVLVMGILPREASAQHPIRKEIGEVNSELSTLSDGKSIFYIDIGASMLEPDGSLTRQVASDLLHPTYNVGYTRMFNALKSEVDQLSH